MKSPTCRLFNSMLISHTDLRSACTKKKKPRGAPLRKLTASSGTTASVLGLNAGKLTGKHSFNTRTHAHTHTGCVLHRASDSSCPWAAGCERLAAEVITKRKSGGVFAEVLKRSRHCVALMQKLNTSLVRFVFRTKLHNTGSNDCSLHTNLPIKYQQVTEE